MHPVRCSGAQLCFTSAFVLLLHCTGVSTLGKPSRRALQARTGTPVQREKILTNSVFQPFAVYTATFAVGVYANIKVGRQRFRTLKTRSHVAVARRRLSSQALVR